MITLYSTGCPRCTVLKKKLEEKGVKYATVTDIDEMMDLGIQSVPVLVADDKVMQFTEAIQWVNEQ